MENLTTLLHSIPGMVHSGNIANAVDMIAIQIEEDYKAGVSPRLMRNNLIQFIIKNTSTPENMNTTALGYWFAFIGRLSTCARLEKLNFMSSFMNALSKVDFDNHPLNLPLTPSQIHHKAFENYTEVCNELLHFLENSRFKINSIKQFSTRPFGKNLLTVIMPFLFEHNALTNNELYELRLYFLETLNQDFFTPFDKAYRLNHPGIEPSETEKIKIDQLNHCSDDLRDKLSPLLVQAKLGLAKFSDTDTDTAAKYILAAIRSDKAESYAFLPTVFHINDFNTYFKEILKLPKPTRESFLIMSSHWTAGEIEIKADGRINLFISDSLGSAEKNSYWLKNNLKSPDFLNLFTDQTVNIYYALEERQYTGDGCKVYALDDVRHFHTMEQYMDESLFEYLDENIDQETEEIADNIYLSFCRLPDALLRTMQSRKVHEMLQTKRINKKGETALESIEKDFIFNPSTEKFENKRIHRKYQTMVTRLERQMAKILQSDDPQQAFRGFEDRANQHTLTGLRARSENQLEKQENASISRQFKDAVIQNQKDAGAPEHFTENKKNLPKYC